VRLLRGARILDLSRQLPGSLAARLLADLGADVLRADSEVGKDLRWRIRHRNKWVVDASPEGAADRFGHRADVVIYESGLGDVVAEAVARSPTLALQLTMSKAEEAATDSLSTDYGLAAIGGLTWISGDPARTPLTPRPHQASWLTALFAATAAAAWLAGDRGCRHIEVVAQEAVAACLEVAFPIWFLEGTVVRRMVNLHDLVWPATTYPTADGWVGISTSKPAETATFMECLDLSFADILPNVERLDPILRDVLLAWPTDALVEAAQHAGVAVAPALRPRDLLRDSQTVARGFAGRMDGFPALLFPGRFASARAAEVRPPRPLNGARWGRRASEAARFDSPSERGSGIGLPLAGVRVLDFSWAVAGPVSTMVLADLGADVVKVESRTHLDTCRLVAPFRGPEGYDTSAYFRWFNRGKRSIELDLRGREQRALVAGLARRADLVIENFRPRTIDRLGLGYSKLRTTNPRLAMCSISGFGRSGPKAGWRSYGAGMAESQSGLAWATGGDRPLVPGRSYADYPTGLYAALVACAQLYRRRTGGGGSYLEVTQFEACASTVEELALDLGEDERERHHVEGSDSDGWWAVGEGGRWPVLDVEDLAEPLQRAGFLSPVTAQDGGTEIYSGLPMTFAGGRFPVGRPAPLLGQHGDEVIAEWEATA
jgi:crotonobetainyl-CoA:carnitine CoA-transferase CaiB-like acyl-CoA transferase